MELTHEFAVPTPVEETWAYFQDISSLAECFPGAQVTSADGDSFSGTCKVKVGPIALVYAGSGTFVERDEAAHRFVVEAKGKDKRGNGTAGATVTLAMSPSGSGTEVSVVTDLAVTGKPAQFGRGVMQDVSDKLLGQFVGCLEERLGGAGMSSEAGERGTSGSGRSDSQDGPDQDTGPASVPAGAAAVGSPADDQDAGPASEPVGAARRAAAEEEDDALDLGSALLPVLLRTYGKQVAAAVLALVALVLVVRRLRR